MNTVCLVACTSRKGDYPAAAEFIYKSPLFSGGRNYAETRCNQWFILSAKYGVLSPNDVIEPYNETLLNLNDEERAAWARRVFTKLQSLIQPGSDIIFLAGSTYRLHLETLLRSQGYRTASPMSMLGIGRQVSWLQKVARNKQRIEHLDQFYKLVSRISQIRKQPPAALKVHSAKSMFPERGVYFFIDCSEFRMTAPFINRITRIGTHSVSEGSKATLWNRLRTHRGGTNGSGNHRGSIFRLHVGESLLRRSSLQESFPSWGVGQSASQEVRTAEEEVELEVSDVIGEMLVVWLDINDRPSADSDRAYIERNSIALMSGPEGPIDLPSDRWLGGWSTRKAIGFSGLWNVNHVYEEYDPHFLYVMECYIEISEKGHAATEQSLAPKGWRLQLVQKQTPGPQISLI
jgi:hypothetical protein